MPRNDSTGPQGLGPMTGRRLGACAGNENVGFGNNFRFGRGLGRGASGMGRGRGYGRNYGNSVSMSSYSNERSIENEVNVLKEQLEFLEKQLSDIRKQDKS